MIFFSFKSEDAQYTRNKRKKKNVSRCALSDDVDGVPPELVSLSLSLYATTELFFLSSPFISLYYYYVCVCVCVYSEYISPPVDSLKLISFSPCVF